MLLFQTYHHRHCVNLIILLNWQELDPLSLNSEYQSPPNVMCWPYRYRSPSKLHHVSMIIVYHNILTASIGQLVGQSWRQCDC